MAAHTQLNGEGGHTVGWNLVGDVDIDFKLVIPTTSEIVFIYCRHSAVNDKFLITDGATGPPLPFELSVTGGGAIIYPGVKTFPYFDYTGSTLGTPANCWITIGFR